MILGVLLPLALAVAWSPLRIVPPLLLVLQSVRARAGALAFLLGSLTGLAAVTAVFTEIPKLPAFEGLDAMPHEAKSASMVVLGAIFIVYAGYTWRRRGRSTGNPLWLNRITNISPLGSLALGLVFSVANLKVFAANAAAGVAIGGAALSLTSAVAVFAGYILLAGSTVIIAVVVYLATADTVDASVAWIRRRATAHYPAIVTVSSVVTGAALLSAGLWLV